MNKQLKALCSLRSTLESLKIQGQSIIQRGNVSMEEADSFIQVADAILEGQEVATISSNTAIAGLSDPDVKLESGVVEIDQRLAAAECEISDHDTGAVPPADSVVSMDDDDAEELDVLMDEAEELDAAAEYGVAIQSDAGLDTDVALENYKNVVTDIFNRIDVSAEAIKKSKTLEEVISEVKSVRDTAEAVVLKVSHEHSSVSTESVSPTSPVGKVIERVGAYVTRIAARNGSAV